MFPHGVLSFHKVRSFSPVYFWDPPVYFWDPAVYFWDPNRLLVYFWDPSGVLLGSGINH